MGDRALRFSFVFGLAMSACSQGARTTTGTTSGTGARGGAQPAPTCCSCNCVDATWSCSKETCLDTAGRAVALVPEAGLFDLPGGSYQSPYNGARMTPRARVWYSFQPAEVAPADKPLVILFNGGPGGPALGMLGFSIGHFTFDPDFTNGAPYADNPARWTDFANLLFVDQPGTGYSYHLPRADGTRPKLAFDSYADAADYLRILFRFVARHPMLAKSPIIIGGESYGGLRSVYMTKLMLDYPSLVAGGPYKDPELYDEITAFLGARRSDIAPSAWTPTDVAQVFTHQILIDPFLSSYQLTKAPTVVPAGCLPNGNTLECDEPSSHLDQIVQIFASTVTDPTLLSTILRCDVSSIAWLSADQRKGAYPRVEGSTVTIDFSKLDSVFGVPASGDPYYVFLNWEVHDSVDLGNNLKHGEVSLRSLHDVPTFITAGQYDFAFNHQFLIEGLATYPSIAPSVTEDPASPAGVVRPGQIDVAYAAGLP